MWFAEWLISIVTYPVYWFWRKASAYREEGKKGSIILLFTLSLRAAEISAEGSSIYEYDPKGKAAFAYTALIKEVINHGE